jgi:hypothetical protein
VEVEVEVEVEVGQGGGGRRRAAFEIGSEARPAAFWARFCALFRYVFYPKDCAADSSIPTTDGM